MEFELVYPPSIITSMIIGKSRFFLADHWVDIGDVEVILERRNTIRIKPPDIQSFVDNLEYLDDGSIDWYFWGPRVN